MKRYRSKRYDIMPPEKEPPAEPPFKVVQMQGGSPGKPLRDLSSRDSRYLGPPDRNPPRRLPPISSDPSGSAFPPDVDSRYLGPPVKGIPLGETDDPRYIGPPEKYPPKPIGETDPRYVGPPEKKPPMPSHGPLPRPVGRTRWNPAAASFGDLDAVWRDLPDSWKSELSGFPMDGVRDYLYLLDLARKNNVQYGKNGVAIVDGQQMDTIDAAKYVLNKMRQVAEQIDQNYIAMRDRVREWQDRQAEIDKQRERAPLPFRVMPITFRAGG